MNKSIEQHKKPNYSLRRRVAAATAASLAIGAGAAVAELGPVVSRGIDSRVVAVGRGVNNDLNSAVAPFYPSAPKSPNEKTASDSTTTTSPVHETTEIVLNSEELTAVEASYDHNVQILSSPGGTGIRVDGTVYINLASGQEVPSSSANSEGVVGINNLFVFNVDGVNKQNGLVGAYRQHEVDGKLEITPIQSANDFPENAKDINFVLLNPAAMKDEGLTSGDVISQPNGFYVFSSVTGEATNEQVSLSQPVS